MAFFEEDSHVIWFHCASLGEFEQGRPVLEAIRKKFDKHKVLLTFFSPSGYEVRKKYEFADFVFYLPADTPANARRFVEITKPSMVFFIKYEFWFNYINELSIHKVPLFFVSSIFRSTQHFFKPWGSWSRKKLQKISHFFVQDQNSLELLGKIGVYHVDVSGDTRFDRVIQISSEKHEVPLISEFIQNTPTLVAGSTWSADENILKELMEAATPDIKLIIAPHIVSEEHSMELMEKFSSFNPVLYSTATTEDFINSRVLVVDTIGLLSFIYRYAFIAYVGGGFGSGIHNILEAATYGLPVVFGPNFSKFNEAVELIELGAAFPIQDASDCIEVFTSLAGNNKKCLEAGEISREYVLRNGGATSKIVNKTSEYLLS